MEYIREEKTYDLLFLMFIHPFCLSCYSPTPAPLAFFLYSLVNVLKTTLMLFRDLSV